MNATEKRAGGGVRLTRALVSTAALLALLGLGVVAFGPVFGGRPGYWAAGGGVVVGTIVGLLAAWRRWTAASTVAASLAAYLLFGGLFALPSTTIAGVIPTIETLQRLAVLAVQSWRDLLTVATPASAYVGPAVVPFLAALMSAVAATSIALRTRHPLLAVVPAFVHLLIAIAWGTYASPAAGLIGVAFVAVALAWGAWVRRHDRAAGAADLLTVSSSRAAHLPVAAAAAVLVGVTAVSLVAVPLLSSGAERQVLRDVVDPPLDLKEYASPLTSYRYLELDQKEAQLFTVTGLPAATRLRLATLDTYDGVVYNVADSSAGFIHIGERLDGAARGEPASLEVEVDRYEGLWLPVVGEVHGVRFPDEDSTDQVRGLYHNRFGGTTLTVAGVREGASYVVDAVVTPPVSREEVADLPVARLPLPTGTVVPELVARAAEDYTQEATSALDQLERLETRLQEGYYSNGSDGSLAGHSVSRLAGMFGKPQLVGGDEQYAAAMALMAQSLGVPARVVMGFYPTDPVPAGEAWTVTGEDAHVWVEVPFAAADGEIWVSFDPTPDRDREPITQSPRPQSNPLPQVQPPPDPPENAPEDQVFEDSSEAADGPEEEGDTEPLRYALIAAGVVSGLLVLAGPFLLIAALKLRRRRRRRLASAPADRLSGGWDEIVDNATDLGTPARGTGTRQEEAHALAEAYPKTSVLTLAREVDAGVFGHHQPTDEDVARLWKEAEAVIRDLNGAVGRWRRLRGRLSLRSFRRTWRRPGPHTPRREERP